MKLAGAAYLIIMGIRTLWTVRRMGGLGVDVPQPGADRGGGRWGAFGMGLFYVAVLPQVVPRHGRH